MNIKIENLEALLYDIPGDSKNWDVRFSWTIDGARFADASRNRQYRISVSGGCGLVHTGRAEVLDLVLGDINCFYFVSAKLPRPEETFGLYWSVGVRDNGADWFWSEPTRLVLTPNETTLLGMRWIGQKKQIRAIRRRNVVVFDLRATHTLERIEFGPIMPNHFKIEISESINGQGGLCLADFSSTPCIIRGAKWAGKIEAKSIRGRFIILSSVAVADGVLNGLPLELVVTIAGRRGSFVFVVPDEKISVPLARSGEIAKEKSENIIVRKDFEIATEIAEAMCTYTGLGYCNFYINGHSLSDDVCWPPFTNYTKRVYCRSVDVTSLLRHGRNTLSATLGNGFRSLPTPDIFGHHRCEWKAPPSFACEMIIRGTNGSVFRWETDDTWIARTGRHVFNCLRGGETIDARIDETGFLEDSAPGKGWRPCEQVPPPSGRLLPDASLPILAHGPVSPVSLATNPNGSIIADFGHIITGIVRFKAGGLKGGRIVVRSNDLILKDGSVDIGNCSQFTYGRFQTDAAVCDEAQHLFEPRYSFKGFRYAEFAGDLDTLDKKSIEALSVTNKLIVTGSMDFSDPVLKRLHAACVSTLASTMHGIPDDSTREKMGWLGENGLHSYGQFMNFEAHRLYRKWLFDMLDTQNADGLVSNMAPECGLWHRTPAGAPPPSHNDPWWCGSLIIVAWNIYLFYNDVDILKIIYPAAKRLMAYIVRHSDEGIVGWNLGDWLELDSKNFPQRSPVACTGTLGLKMLSDLMSQIAITLRRPNDAAHYRTLALKTAKSFRKRFGGQVYNPAFNSQAIWALMLQLGIVTGSDYDRILELLVDNIKCEYRGHLSTGSIGTLPVLMALGRHGYDDLTARVLTQKEYPGYGHMLKQGATALWENWNGLESQCHVTYVGVHEFLYESFGAFMPRWNLRTGVYLRFAPGRALSLGNCYLRQRQPLLESDITWSRAKRGMLANVSWKAAHPVLFDLAKCRMRGETVKIFLGNRQISMDVRRRFIKLPTSGIAEIHIDKHM